MTKWELIREIGQKTGVKQEDVNKILDAFAETIVISCRDNGEKVTVPGLGTFKQKINAAHTGHNPATGKPMEIGESRSIALTVSSSVKVKVEPKKGKKK